ncbi:MAG TPA: hypothetical protein DC038_07005 [Clostridiales bacterium]|nr:hypothetical protein [Clostridiales bacterium]
MFFYAKSNYTAELKLEIVQKYFNEKVSIYSLETGYGISKGDIRKWSIQFMHKTWNLWWRF